MMYPKLDWRPAGYSGASAYVDVPIDFLNGLRALVRPRVRVTWGEPCSSYLCTVHRSFPEIIEDQSLTTGGVCRGSITHRCLIALDGLRALDRLTRQWTDDYSANFDLMPTRNTLHVSCAHSRVRVQAQELVNELARRGIKAQ